MGWSRLIATWRTRAGQGIKAQLDGASSSATNLQQSGACSAQPDQGRSLHQIASPCEVVWVSKGPIDYFFTLILGTSKIASSEADGSGGA